MMCKNLLKISQEEIDNANEFPIVSIQISEFIDFYTKYSLCICSWGPDYIRISENAIRNNACDPFDTLPRMDLVKEALKVFGVEGNHVLRDDIKEKLGLKKVLNRHNAIADALDLLDITFQKFVHTGRFLVPFKKRKKGKLELVSYLLYCNRVTYRW